MIAVRHPNVVQHSAAPQFIDAVIILLGMRHLHKLKSVRLMLQMNAVHTIHTPRSGNTGGFQNRGAVLLAAFNNVPIDGGIGNAGHFQIPQNIFFQPERKGLAERPLALEAVAAKLDPGLLPQLAFAGQDTRNRVPPGLPFKFVQRRFFHVVTTPCRNLEGSVQKVFVILAVVNRLLSVLVQQFSIESCQTVRLSLSCAVDNIRNLFGDDRIAVLLKNLSERIARAKPNNIVLRFYEIAQFGVFQPRVNIFKIVGNPFSKILDTGNRSLTGIAYIRPIQQSAPQNNIPFKRIEVHEKRKATIRTNFKLIFIFSTAFTYHPIKKGKCFARCRSLRILKDRFANLDELNYLAKRMESFDYHEYDQFLIGITKLQNPTEKDLINLTFNLDHFTLCKDVSSYGKIGREYVMNTQGAVPAHDEDDPKYAAIGKDLIDRGLAQITAKGLLIYNPFDELTEVYDGQAFPEYFYENTLASAEVSYNGRTELLLLPGEEIAIQKALARLGAPSDSDCEIKFCLNQGEDDAWEERIEGIIRSEGLYETNKMLRSLDTDDMDWGKLTAAVELADVKSAANIAAVAQHLGEFGFLPDAKSESDVGHFLVNNVDEYGMNIEMEEYFDFSGFGEYFAEEHDGQFVNGGFVYFDSDRSLDEFLEELVSEDEGMDMGGM